MKVSIIQPAGGIICEMNKDARLTKNFVLSELANNAGNPQQAQYLFSPESYKFNECLQRFRDYCGRPVIINSGYRQIGYNKSIGGDKNSLHLKACAADIQPVTDEHGDTNKLFYHIEHWFNTLGASGLIGAINIYPHYTYYHLEAFSDIYLGYTKSTIRVYSSNNDYNFLRDCYSYYLGDINIMRCY